VAIKSKTEDSICLHCTVIDTGIGIPREKQSLIFDAFTQADNSTTRLYGGTGLGLAISAELVELMQGIIWVESEVGQGSRFHFTARFGLQKSLPANPAPKEVSLKEIPVLIVDDNLTSRNILQEILADWGMKPTLVDSGEAALAELERALAWGKPFPLVLLDSNMPDGGGLPLASRIKNNPAFQSALILMLSASGQLEEAAQSRQLGIKTYLTKPVRQSDLLNTVMTALGKTGHQKISAKGLWPPRLSKRPQRILLAEDHPVNQRLAKKLLEKWGHKIVLADNGRRALQALEHGPFDLVLMDLQMPGMGGLEATALIREKEKLTGKRIPIIAMTAHAMKSDHPECARAGMDGYVAKPLDAQLLFDTIEKVGLSLDLPAPLPVPVSLPHEAHLDPKAILDRVEGDAALLKEVTELFVQDAPKMLAEIETSIRQNDPGALERAAHTLKGAIGNFGAPEACQIILMLESMGRDGDLARASETFICLERETEHLISELQILTKAKAA
jgi:CheY-like chemotaxis protein